MAQSNDAAVYFYAPEGEQQRFGPVSVRTLSQLLQNGDIDGFSLIWTQGMPSWLPLSELDELRARIRAAEPSESPEAAADTVKNAGADTHTHTHAATHIHVPPPSDAAAGASGAVWFYADESGTRIGPITQDALESLVSASYVTRDTLVWRTGMCVWAHAHTCAELAHLFAEGGGAHDAAAPAPAGQRDTVAAGGKPSGSRGGILRSVDAAEAALAALERAAAGKGAQDGTSGNNAGTRGSRGRAEDGADGQRRSERAGRQRDVGVASDASQAAATRGLRADGVASSDASASATAPGKRSKPEDAIGDDGDDDSAAGEQTAGAPKQSKAAKRKKKKRGAQAQADSTNAWIHVTGIPADSNLDELAEFFKRAGIIKLDYSSAEPKIRVRRASPDAATVEAFICYLREEAVELAIQLLDGADLRPGAPLLVEPADPAAIPKDGAESARPGHRKLTAEEAAAKVRALEQQAALSWAEEGDESLGLKVVVLKHAFRLSEVATIEDADDLREDLAQELTKVGTIDKLNLYPPLQGPTADNPDPEGVVMIKFHSAGSAAACISLFNGRFFGGRKLQCQYWDGVTDYSGKGERAEGAADEDAGSADEAEQRRLEEYGAWLEGGEDTV